MTEENQASEATEEQAPPTTPAESNEVAQAPPEPEPAVSEEAKQYQSGVNEDGSQRYDDPSPATEEERERDLSGFPEGTHVEDREGESVLVVPNVSPPTTEGEGDEGAAGGAAEQETAQG